MEKLGNIFNKEEFMIHAVVQGVCLFSQQNLLKIIVEILVTFLFMVRILIQLPGKWLR